MQSPLPSEAAPTDCLSRVTVAVRVKPIGGSEGELLGLNQTCVFPQDKSTKTIVVEGESKTLNFTYDYLHWSNTDSRVAPATQEDIYEDLGKPVVLDALQGFNVSMFAYGQTGSGKTYTMMGPSLESCGDPSLRGLIPRIGEALFQETTKLQEAAAEDMRRSSDVSEGGLLESFISSYHFIVSYVEIYMEKVQDLLVPVKGTGQCLKIREHPKTGPYVDGVTMVPVDSYAEVEQLINLGSSNRMVACTNMNSVSSRSHAVFTIYYTKRIQDPDSGAVMDSTCKINLVDLAGSENANSAGTTGERLKEGSYINKSLLTLGMVIKALAERQTMTSRRGSMSVKTVVPYRDSVLTFLLRDSLGGNSRTTMIAAIRPDLAFIEETISTLRYADRAKSIVNYAIVNEDPLTKKVRLLQEQIDKLIKELGESRDRENEKNAKIQDITSQLTAALERRGAGMSETNSCSSGATTHSTVRSFNLLSCTSENSNGPWPFDSPRLPGCDTPSSPFHHRRVMSSGSPSRSPHLSILAHLNSPSPRGTSPRTRSPLFAVRSTSQSSPTVSPKSQQQQQHPPPKDESVEHSADHPSTSEVGKPPMTPESPISPLTSSNTGTDCPPTFRTCPELEDTGSSLLQDLDAAPSINDSASSSRSSSPSQAITELAADVTSMDDLVPTPPKRDLSETASSSSTGDEQPPDLLEAGQTTVVEAETFPPLYEMAPSPSRTLKESESVLGVTSPMEIVMQGFLLKRGHFKVNYSRRFFVMQGNVLLWYTKFHDPKSIRGAVKLRGCRVEMAEDEAAKGYPFAFRIFPRFGPRSEVVLEASSDDERWKWVQAIQECSLLEDNPLLEEELEESLGKLLSGCNIL